MRAIAESAYRRGAKFVDVAWFDPWVKRARIEHAREDTLEFVPPWYGERDARARRARAPRAIALSGPVAPGLLDDLDPVRAGRDRLPAVKESGKVVNDRTTNWTIVPVPDARRGPRLVYPDLARGRGAGQARASSSLHVLRLDERGPDRRLARARRHARRRRRAADRAPLRRAALRGPGHRPDRRPAARARAGRRRASRPSTASSTCRTSRPRRSSRRPTRSAPTAHVTSTKPLVLIDGTVVRDLRVRFEGGRAVERRRRPARRDDAHDRRSATRAPRGSARSRWSTARAASARSTRSSTTRCSTRTRRATSRSARASRSWSPTATPTASTTSRDPHRLHDRLAASSTSPASPPTASACRCSRRAPGRSRSAATLSRRSWRGAGAAERARLEIV